ncbi:MAG: glucosaminidase domain-containing protein [Acidimicrobiales bacterium]|nr:glucosaminidase domain-containing protein [Acidimicrobiales bacterium]
MHRRVATGSRALGVVMAATIVLTVGAVAGRGSGPALFAGPLGPAGAQRVLAAAPGRQESAAPDAPTATPTTMTIGPAVAAPPPMAPTTEPTPPEADDGAPAAAPATPAAPRATPVPTTAAPPAGTGQPASTAPARPGGPVTGATAPPTTASTTTALPPNPTTTATTTTVPPTTTATTTTVPPTTAPATPPAGGTPIAGPSALGADGWQAAAAWAQGKGAAQVFVDLARLYWTWAPQAGIRPEVAYAQAALETGWGRFGGAITAAWRNPAGIKTAGATGDAPDDHQRFPTWDAGVRAHVNHLSAYAGAPTHVVVVDPATEPHPRYAVVASAPWAGTVKTVEQLGGRWAPSAGYGQRVAQLTADLVASGS